MTDTNRDGNRSTGAGAEAAEGIHAADSPRDESKKSSVPDSDRQADGEPSSAAEGSERRGSEPTTSHPTEHQSGYGGGGANGGSKDSR